ncbi:Proline-specific permease AltName: Full=Proline transport protein [Serendipita indica DSM 11827]|uniref:Probable DIP5-glutamate and aspartate permease n=1 Tax=Serendipita indica (strain DSM 11827) TaxID=1109443 RepID=G4TED8_SERID|nr:Proline-specific permease AltName: Full=Proline transport protein [Serendipita indica DSM 11827]CCA69669.1 probable DIP5-glutamate and aspartate permease [Serendipita indica DSM 11827]
MSHPWATIPPATTSADVDNVYASPPAYDENYPLEEPSGVGRRVSIVSDAVSVEKVEVIPKDVSPKLQYTTHRGLKARQMSMIALGGIFGTGLIIGGGTALNQGGPLGILIGYGFVGAICYFTMESLCEMATFLPNKRNFIGFVTRFVHPSVGFAVGWIYLFKLMLVIPSHINSAGIIISYWTTDAPIAMWNILFTLLIFITNILYTCPGLRRGRVLGVKVDFQLMSFGYSNSRHSVKILTLIGLVLFGILVAAGVNPHHDKIGFRYWVPPYGPLGHYFSPRVSDSKVVGQLLGVWAVMVTALYAFGGMVIISVTAGEATSRKEIPPAFKRTYWRVFILYILGVFVIGLIVPSNHPNLFASSTTRANAGASPFVLAASLVGVGVLRHVINAALLIFVVSAAATDLFIGSRVLFGLALEKKAPAIFLKVNRWGIPWTALLFCSASCFISFINVAKGSVKAFSYFTNLASTCSGLTWICILIAHIRFMKALQLQGWSREALPYQALKQPSRAKWALFATTVIMIFKGYDAFLPFKADAFVTAYVMILVFFAFMIFWYFKSEERAVRLKYIDLLEGQAEIDEHESWYLARQAEKGPPSFTKRLWDAL